jgi:anaerobic magnesium-protoporphyrin IX monomethyl ester cyclase
MKSNKELTVAVVNVVNKTKPVAMNKDLNGGFGTADVYSNGLFEGIIQIIKRRSIKIPIISLAFLMGIFKQKCISAKYYEGSLPRVAPDLILIYGSIVDFHYENKIAKLLKSRFKHCRVGFIGPFPSTKPELFSQGDFVIKGDFEEFFLNHYHSLSQLEGIVKVDQKCDLDQLPSPELSGFPIAQYGYFPAIIKKPFFTLQASRGCPYSCGYYCVYGSFQGKIVSTRSAKKVVQDILYLRRKYGIKGFQFRDATFGVQKGYFNDFSEEMKKSKVNVQWGMETRIDLLDKESLKKMFDVGLRNINIGIETSDPNVAKKNKRVLASIKRQEEIVKYCEKLGIKVSAFYLFGYDGETKETMLQTLNYAKKINTFLARFAVSTPYPGTQFFDKMKSEGRLVTEDYEKYTQFSLVTKNNTFSANDVERMRLKAYREYYFRPKYILKFLQWKIREFWL